MKSLSIFALLSIFAILPLIGCTGDETPDDGVVSAEEFAQCLTDKGFIMYGTSWDEYSNAQAWMFGEGFEAVNYVRCDDPPGGNSISQECLDVNIQYVPTWIGPDDTLFGLQTLSKLAALSGCEEPEDWLYDAKFDLAACLNDQGAVMYGTTWCSYCKMQLSFFGDAADEIEYVTCDRLEDPYLQEPICAEKNIVAYPTWIFDGDERVLGFLFPWEFAKQRACAWPEQPEFGL